MALLLVRALVVSEFQGEGVAAAAEHSKVAGFLKVWVGQSPARHKMASVWRNEF